MKINSLPLILILAVVAVIVIGGITDLPYLTAERRVGESVDKLEEEEFAVFNELINQVCVKDKTKLIVIQDQTSGAKTGADSLSETLQFVGKRLPGIGQDTLDDFSRRNDMTHVLEDKFHLNARHALASKAELLSFGHTQDFWKAFYNKYPDAQGLTILSKVGFNSSADQALVYVGKTTGSLGGAGYYILLEKSNSEWVIQNKVQIWVL